MSFRGTVLDFLNNLSNVIDAVVGGGVDLDHIHGSSIPDPPAGIAGTARIAVIRMLAVYCLRQNLGDRRFARPAGPHEKIGMLEASVFYLIPQRPGDVLLTFYLVKGLRPELAV
jgi:hypothetical protein